MVDTDFERKVREVMEARQVRIERVCALLRGMVMGMVCDMDSVQVEAIDGSPRMLLRLTVAPAEISQLVGKKGRTARSLRQIVAVAAARNDLDCDLDIVQHSSPAVS